MAIVHISYASKKQATSARQLELDYQLLDLVYTRSRGASARASHITGPYESLVNFN